MAKDYYSNNFDIQLSRFMAESIANDYTVDMFAAFSLFSALKYQVRAGRKIGGEPTSENEEARETQARNYDLKKRNDYIKMVVDQVKSPKWTEETVLKQLEDWSAAFLIWEG